MLTVCVPVLRRYDLLEQLALSLVRGTVVPDSLCIIDNGGDSERIRATVRAADGSGMVVRIVRPEKPMGVAEAWNWFIRRVPEDRLIVNDDIQFSSTAIERMVASTACFVSCTHGFACFLLRDECVRRVGEFDESISPGYAYFEDRDYYNRMQLAGIEDEVINCGVVHGNSRTIAAFNDQERSEHQRKFVIAQENFLRKWGKLPDDLVRQFA